MLEQSDLLAIRKIFGEVVAESEIRVLEKVEAIVEDAVASAESFVMKEMDRVEGNIRGDIEALEKRVETMEGLSRMQNTEAETIKILLKAYEQLEKRLEVLEKKIA